MRTARSMRIVTALAVLAAALALLLPGPPARAGSAPEWSFEGVERVVAIGDVHGAHDGLLEALRAAGLVDERLRWSGGATHLVSVGDLVDRGDDSRRVLDLLMRLEGEARQAGGRVHVVPGNHDVMVVTGDLRYVAPGEYAAFADDEDPAVREAAFRASGEPDRAAFDARHPPGWFAHRAAFAPDGRYGRWIVSRPAIVRIDGTLFVHGGLSEAVLDVPPGELAASVGREALRYVQCRDRLVAAGDVPVGAGFAAHLAAAEARIERPILASGRRARRRGGAPEADAAARCIVELRLDGLAFSGSGPLWYRGLAWHDAASESELLDTLLEQFGATRVVVGHTPTDSRRIESRLDGRVLLIDTGMLVEYYDGRPSALVIEKGVSTALYAGEGAREPPRTGPEGQPARRAPAWHDRQTGARLATAAIAGVEPLSSGITGPRRVTLEDGGGRLRAVFKWFDSFREGRAQRNPLRRINGSDRYQYELAAWRLDRRLGLGLVPTTVRREVEGRPGILQAWVEEAIDEAERREREVEPPDRQAYLRDLVVLDLFDSLIHNEDRHTGNILFTRDPWRLHLIDHTRAFRAKRDRPRNLRDRTLVPERDLRLRLLLLDRAALDGLLGDLLEPLQIEALLERRDALLREAAAVRPAPDPG